MAKKTNDSSYWLSVHDSYPLLGKKASIILVQFATTCLCEAVFPDLASMTTKSRNRFNVCSVIFLARFKMETNIKRSLQASTRTRFTLTTLI